MKALLIRCPYCGNVLIRTIEGDYKNRRVECDVCKRQFRIYTKKDNRIIMEAKTLTDLLAMSVMDVKLPKYYIVTIKCYKCGTVFKRKIIEEELNKPDRFFKCPKCRTQIRFGKKRKHVIKIEEYKYSIQ